MRCKVLWVDVLSSISPQVMGTMHSIEGVSLEIQNGPENVHLHAPDPAAQFLENGARRTLERPRALAWSAPWC